MSTDIGFSPNFTHLYELDIDPTGAGKYARMAAGIKKIDPDPSETVTEDEYYDGDGLGSADVTGAKWKITCEGDRRYGDPVQDFIASLKFSFGESRRTNIRITNPDGEIIEGGATIANIKTFGGDANSKATLSFDIYVNGLPKYTKPSATELPSAVSVSGGGKLTVAKGGYATIEPTVNPDTASKRCVFATSDPSVVLVDADGVVTAVADSGEAEVSVKCAAKPSVQTVVTVTVGEGTEAQGASSARSSAASSSAKS